mmetsp:Transcript_54149/g.137569  ORF Transcript_54149/g.137569 Transcript_54149/m.137569 type:complete len:931 (+) Transcript_54149:60-2852(+)
MSEASRSPARSTPQAVPGTPLPARSPRAATEPGTPLPARSPRAAAEPGTPLPARSFLSPTGRLGPIPSPQGVDASPRPPSAASASPQFARTPRSGASPVPSPSGSGNGLLSPPPPSLHSGVERTPRRRPRVGSPATGSDTSSRRGPKAPHRGFMGSPPKTPHRSNAGADPGDDGGDDGAGADEGNFLYGTDINEMEIVNAFVRFIWRFRTPETEGDQSYYIQQLHRKWEECMQKEKGIKFPLSGEHIHQFSPALYGHMVNFPTEVIPIFDRELWSVSVHELRAEPEDLGTIQVQVHSLLEKDSKIMRSMNPTDIERLMSLKGIVIRVSDLIPDMLSAVFRCTVEDCKHEVAAQLSHWAIEEPTRCEGCGASHSFQIVHNDSTFADRQMLKLQEPPELVPDGETPQNVAVCVFDDLVDQVRPGDRVEVTGIYRASPVRPNQNWRQCSSVYRTYVDAIAIAAEKKGRIDTPSDEYEFAQGQPPRLADKKDLDPESNSEEDVKWHKLIRDLGMERDEQGNSTIVGKLVQSFAPSIYEEDEVKKGLLCQLFSGTPKIAGASSKGRSRPEINTMLCGDPSTAKSQLMQYAFKLAPRGVYTSGKGSSAVGLTASINKDPATGDLVLESGALVLSDRGICCIDEFDKMDESARAILHEAMEQQTVSVAKAGIVCSLNARCSILASANPKESSYDPKLSIVENINLPKNLMSRFDLIWLMLDKRNKDTDSRLAAHLVSMYSVAGMRKRVEPAVDSELFRRYVSFARRWVFPEIKDEAADALVKGYTDLRNQGNSREVITATPRILESLIRTSESLAKMELREEVTVADVDEAIRLLKAATYAAAVDPETGLIDMEQLIVGMGAAKRKRAKELETLFQEVLAEREGESNFSIDDAKRIMNERLGERKEQLATEAEFNIALRSAEQSGAVRRQGRFLEAR